MNSNIPFFSVIIPTYNRGHIIHSAIDSVVHQLYKNWELIIIDDGSTDNTKEVVSMFNDPRIKYVFQQNTERSIARNNGIKMANGTYICFLDSDDVYCHNHLEIFYKTIEKGNFPEAMFFTNPIVIDQLIEKKAEVPIYNGENSLSYILKNSIIPDRVCIHKNIFQKYQFNPKVHIGEDTILWAEITNYFPMFHINDYTVKYLIHDDNSVNLKNNVYKNRLDGLLALFREQEIKQRLSSTLKNQMMSVCYFGIARHYQLKRKFFKMSINAILSILYDPKHAQNKAKLYMIYSYFRQ